MTLWIAVLAAAAATFALRLAGHLVPPGVLSRPAVARVTQLLPPALLASLVVIQTATAGRTLVLDARVVGLGIAAVALMLRAPFLAVVTLAAAATALTRLIGWG